jgi:hypothetical protein
MIVTIFKEQKYLCITASFVLLSLFGYSQRSETPSNSLAAVVEQSPVNNFQKSEGNESILISNLRPRIFVRSDKATIGRGLTLSALRSRSKDPEYKDCIDYNGKIEGFESLPPIAMQYLLKGEKRHATIVGDYLVNNAFPLKEHTSTASAVYNSAIAFDWVRDALSDEMIAKITAKLVEGAEHLKDGVEKPSVNHNYTIVSLHGIAMVALAVYGEGEENTQKSLEYLKLVQKTIAGDQMILHTLKEKNGTWGEGNHYTPFVVFYPFLMTLRGVATATNTDYFAAIKERYENFLEPMSKFVVANFRPDFTLERIGDVTGRVVPNRTFLRPLIDMLASEVHNVQLQGQLHSFSKELSAYHGVDLVPDFYRWMLLAFYDSKLPDKPSYTTFPNVMRFGENSYEHIVFRNKWSEDATQITYISGDHYTDHQHFDKGHFLIYKKGGLIVDAGGYSGMYAESWSNYSTRTLAHNNVLVYDPAEPVTKGISGTTIYPDGGQRVIRGAQAQSSWQEYMKDNKTQGLNTADVLAFDYDRKSNSYNYVKSDLTTAYGDKVKWIDRQLLYLPLVDYMVVKDRVISSTPLDKYWMLHFEEAPKINGGVAETGISEFKNNSIVQSTRSGNLDLTGKTVQYGGGLLVKTILPKQKTITIIGGPGYEYYSRFVKKNFAPERPFLANREAGNWRMDVSAKQPTTAMAFMHAFEITASDKKVMVPAEYIKSAVGTMEGTIFRSKENPYVVLFSSSLDSRGDKVQRARLPITYKLINTGHTNHVLVELEPNKKVKVIINNKVIGTLQTTAAGVLTFKDKGAGTRTIQLKPA